ncbi:hypothetical protein TNCV_1773641 [Trichonephila clavipes]|nr:hypothetical protein TNCV_1773641 [Trichonephila clavipes]
MQANGVSAKTPCFQRNWAAKPQDWMQSDWSQMLFTDESGFILMCDARRVLDKTRNHTARLVETFLEAETLRRMEWPTCSPYLNLIQYV